MSGPRRETITHSTFPDLRILPIDALLPHEEHDAQHAQPLLERLRSATGWLNPPVIAPIEDTDCFVILDGAHRHYCLQTLGFAHILAQVVSYNSPAVTLDTWHHAVRGLPAEELLSSLHAVQGVAAQETTLLSARAALASRTIVAYVVSREGVVVTLHNDDASVTRTAMLRRVVDSYRHRGDINRVTHDAINDVNQLYPDVAGIVVFPPYKPEEITVAARDGDLLPPGITRHVIRGRALRLNYPLDELRANNTPLTEKNARLRQWLQERLDAKQVRFYAEPTFLFDE